MSEHNESPQLNDLNVTRNTDTSRLDDGVMFEAAKKIQRIWRKYIDLQVFKYYKDLVLFHNEGDPALIMKYINPIEAKLIDSASGIHIKFRLAGNQFPPTIYYKIYTHRPVQDICANAPRDYTKVKMKTAAMKNNRIRNSKDESVEGWYKRIENNGWRPVSTKHLLQMNMDYYYGVEGRFKPVTFQHTKLLRKKDMELKRRTKKIEWMKKMYKNGMLKLTSEEGKEEDRMIEDTAQNLINIYEKDGIECIEDWEVDELLEWTNTLSFKEYTENWRTLGTTAKSDKLVIERKAMKGGDKFNQDILMDELFESHSSEFTKAPLHASTHRYF